MSVYGIAKSEFAEKFNGSYASREEAIAEGTTDYGGEPFYVLEGEYPTASEMVPDQEWVLERIGDYAVDNYGEVALGFPQVTDEAKAELDAMLKAWADKHIKVEFWTGVRSPELIEPE